MTAALAYAKAGHMDATIGFVPVSDVELLNIEGLEVATPEQLRRLVAELRLLRTATDYTAPAEVAKGKDPFTKASLLLQKLGILTCDASDGIRAMVTWLEQQEGTKGIREKPFKLVTHDGRCIQIREPQPDKVHGRHR